MVILVFILSICSAILYRLGGAGKVDDGWNWARRSWVRDWLIPPVVLTTLWLMIGFAIIYWWQWLLLLAVWLLMGGAFSTYWDEVPFNKGKDNFYMHGFFVGLATFPLFWLYYSWVAILIYAVALSLAMGLFTSTKFNAVIKELFRGAVVVLFLLIFKWIG